jgi:membrane protease YdiL (CAAX protease family)
MIVVASIVGAILVELVPELLGTGGTEPAENPVGDIIAENPELVLGAIVFMFLVVGPAEEILFRGVVQNRIRERFSKLPGIVIASFLFAFVHVVALAGQDPVGIAMTITVLFVTSLGLGWIYEYTGNIVVPALLHGFHNSVIVAVTALGAIYDFEEATILLAEVLRLVPL